ncbi:putative baseplate assembly protein [Rhodococcus aetherivorans]|uniref:putative baseplate assembly protein n=1 Tax=Rhodococcus aetherivorans TaxID=191292 RepID=UPI00366D59CB
MSTTTTDTGSGGTGCGGESDCECCAGLAPVTPVSVANRPGLHALRYRIGTHPQFLATMRARLSGTDHPGLAALTSRDPADMSLALLDGWAAVADVLTFYTERIANEGYLRTATERWSVVQLARLVGYSPRPGLSATAHLAYTVTAGREVDIPAGSKAQSIPGPSELPATFETADTVVARGEYSSLTVRRSRPQLLTPTTLATATELVIAGTLTDARRGDVIYATIAPDTWALFEVTALTVDTQNARTTLSVALRRSEDLGKPPEKPSPAEIQLDGETTLSALTKALGKPPSVPPPTARELSRDLFTLYDADSAGLGQLLGIVAPEIASTLGAALAHTVAPDPAPPALARMKVKAPLFGHLASPYPVYTDGTVTGYLDPMDKPLHPIPDMAAEADRDGGGDNTEKTLVYKPRDLLDLDAVYNSVEADSRVILINPDLAPPVAFRTVTAVTPTTVTAFGVSGLVSRLTLDRVWPDEPEDPLDLPLATVVRGTTVLAQDDPLTPADESMDDVDVGGDVVELAGLHPDLGPGRSVIVTGERTDDAIRAAQNAPDTKAGTGVYGGELSMIASVEHRVARVPADDTQAPPVDLPGDTVHTFVHLAAPLAYTYRRSTVTIYGNVARATHGDTRTEVLGSGDATRRFPEFPLKQPPLTYLPTPTAVGAESTAQVFVDSVRWHEADDLIGAGPNDRRYTLRTDDSGATSVVFGDGVRGALPPTGQENIHATYRSGIGVGGNVGAGRIALVTSKPLGVTEVINPLPATGGADREGRDAIARNAALGVQALDRLVSVSDYEDFAAAFAGIGTASARELSDGRRMLVHVSIGGVDDAPIAVTSDLARNLRAALLELGDPYQDVQVAIRVLRLLVISARVRVDPDHRWADVEPAVCAALLDIFGPGHRRIGQPVTSAAVLATIQATAGVEYVDLDILDSLGESELVAADPAAGLTLRTVVPARLAGPDPNASPGGGIRPAELVLLSPAAPDTLILSELT